MNAFDDNRLHHVLDEVAGPAQVPPLPYQAIVRDGTRRRRRRRALGGLTACAAVAAAAVLATTAWSRPEAVSPAAPVGTTVKPSPRTSPSAADDLPVRSTMPSGELNGSHWSIHVVDYREQGDGLYCEDWKIVVDGHENPDNNGSCSSDPNDAGTLNDGVTIQRDPRVASSALLGVMFEGNMAPVGAVTLRVTWAGGSVSAPVFALPHDDRRYFFLAVPYAPGHPDAYYDARLDFLDARGHAVPSVMLQAGGQPYSVKPMVKQ